MGSESRNTIYGICLFWGILGIFRVFVELISDRCGGIISFPVREHTTFRGEMFQQNQGGWLVRAAGVRLPGNLLDPFQL